MTKFNLIICEIFNDWMHGYDERSDPNILGHYLTIDKFITTHTTSSNLLDCNLHSTKIDDNDFIYDVIKMHKIKYYDMHNQLSFKQYKHPIIPNYMNIIKREKYIQLEIAECIYLSGGECIAILKTFWIRIIQRTWKKRFQQYKKCLMNRTLPSSILYREIHGKWHPDCNITPSLYGLLTS